MALRRGGDDAQEAALKLQDDRFVSDTCDPCHRRDHAHCVRELAAYADTPPYCACYRWTDIHV